MAFLKSRVIDKQSVRNLEAKALSTENLLIHFHNLQVFKIFFSAVLSGSVFSNCRQKGHHAKPYFHQSVSEADNGIIYHILLFNKRSNDYELSDECII